MGKWIIFFGLVWLLGVVLGSINQGSGGVQKTVMTASITDVSTTVTVSSTQNFTNTNLNIGIIEIGSEKILYTNKDATHFLNCTRGYQNTKAVAHANGSGVYTMAAGQLDAMSSYNLQLIRDATGPWWFINAAVSLMKMLVNVLFPNFEWLGDFGTYVRIVHSMLIVGFITVIVLNFRGAKSA